MKFPNAFFHTDKQLFGMIEMTSPLQILGGIVCNPKEMLSRRYNRIVHEEYDEYAGSRDLVGVKPHQYMGCCLIVNVCRQYLLKQM